MYGEAVRVWMCVSRTLSPAGVQAQEGSPCHCTRCTALYYLIQRFLTVYTVLHLLYDLVRFTALRPNRMYRHGGAVCMAPIFVLC